MRAVGWLRLTIVVVAPLLGCLAAKAETAVERGAYLVTTIGACGNCHSPRDATGRILPGTELSGGFSFDDAVGRVVGPNITPDHETGIGAWTDSQIITALREGHRPDGTIIGPPMPIPVYKELSDGDAGGDRGISSLAAAGSTRGRTDAVYDTATAVIWTAGGTCRQAEAR